ncbi:MAG: ABC transporter permease [Verrucomicrobiota bacterium]
MRTVAALFSSWTWRMAWRDSRASRRRLLLFSSSISLGIAALVAIGSLGRNLQSAIREQSKALLGADLVLSSRQPLGTEAEALIQEVGGEAARETSFSTMIVLTNGTTRLVNARALTGNFPFYGTIETDPPGAAVALRSGGGVLVEESLLQQFQLRRGDTVSLGNASFQILGTLRRVPGDSIVFATLAPRVYLDASDLPRTGLLRPGSLARYRVFFRLGPETSAEAWVDREKPRLERLKLQDETVRERQRDLGGALENLQGFLNLVALIALILGAIGIASALQVHLRQKLLNVAVLRCLGAQVGTTVAIYLAQGLALGTAGTAVGIGLGAAVSHQLPGLVQGFLPFRFEHRFDAPGALLASLAGFSLCTGFTLLPLLPIRRVSPLAAIRSAYEPSHGRDPLIGSVLGLLLVGVAAFAVSQTRRWQEGLGYAGGLAGAFALLWGAGHLTIHLCRRLPLGQLPFVWRQGLASLHRPHNRTVLLLVAIGLGTFLILTLHLTRNVLLEQLFPDRGSSQPNTVLFDIPQDQRDGVARLLAEEGLPLIEEAPIVTMRLQSLKGVPVGELIRRKELAIPDWTLKREYRSTWRSRVNESERVVAGVFHGSTTNAGALRPVPDGDPRIAISVEAGIARDLRIGIGDEIVWDVQGVPVATWVSSLREVNWRQIRPNFFVVFPEGSLDAAPAMVVMASRVRDANQSAALQRRLVAAYPNVSAIDLTLVLQTLDDVLTRIGFVLRFMAFFTVLTGLVVLAGSILNGRWQRVQESILLRTLGASRVQIRQILLAEYAALGLLSAVMASGLAVAGSWALARFAFKAPYAVSPLPIAITLGIVPMLTAGVGLLTSRGIADQPPLEILRREG